MRSNSIFPVVSVKWECCTCTHASFGSLLLLLLNNVESSGPDTPARVHTGESQTQKLTFRDAPRRLPNISEDDEISTA